MLFFWAPTIFYFEAKCEEAKLVWPNVAEIEKTFHFDFLEQASIDLNLLGEGGKELYCLSCHTFGYTKDSAFDYSGEFECRLKSLYSLDTYSTLLTENPKQFADWDHRARFFSSDLVGECGLYPDYGRSRSFQLRGMIITLEIDNLTFRSSYIEADSSKQEMLELNSFEFHVKVKSAPFATTEIAKPSIYLGPPIINPGTNNYGTRDCSSVKIRTEK